MKLVKLLLLLLATFSPLVQPINATLRDPSSTTACTQVLLSKLTHLRAEIAESNQKDLDHSGRRAAHFSNFISNRAIDFNSTVSTDTHIISLGSGPDLFLPLYEFPTAAHFHLVDLLTGWGSGPKAVLSEIEARLHAIAEEVVVTEVESITQTYLWRVEWKSPSEGKQTKYFHLYQMDYGSLSGLKQVLDVIKTAETGKPELGGLVMTGASAPPTTLEFLLEQMIPGGTFFTEMNYVSPEGEIIDPESLPFIAKLRRTFSVSEYKSEIRFRNSPTRYVFQKR